MRKMISLLIGSALALALVSPSEAPRAAALTIGTGGTQGIYYYLGRAICRLVTETDPEGVTGCEAISTGGSVTNIRDLRAGELQLGIVQSDLQFDAVEGRGAFQAAGAYGELRSLFSAHGEPFTLVARRDAGIKTFDQLPGKRVNLGNPGSGQRATMEAVMAAKGWSEEDFLLASELPADQQSLALCHDRVQAMVYVVGHPNDSVAQAIELCQATVVPVQGKAIDQLVAKESYYTHVTIPAGVYPGVSEPVPTFGVRATVVSSTEVDADLVYAVVKSVFENLDALKELHPAFGDLEPVPMIEEGLSAPLHEGAARYYRERGWM